LYIVIFKFLDSRQEDKRFWTQIVPRSRIRGYIHTLSIRLHGVVLN
jgi:hypothetical protein